MNRLWQEMLWILVGVLVLGLSVYTGLRCRTVYRLDACGVVFGDWTGWWVGLEEKLRGGAMGRGELPLSAGLPFCFPQAVGRIRNEGIDSVYPGTFSVGRALRSLGAVGELFLFLEDDYEEFYWER